MHKYFIQNLIGREISTSVATLFLAAAMAVLAGCGAGQANPTVPLPVAAAPGTGPAAASLQLLTSSSQIQSAGTTTIDLTAIVLSSTKETISGKSVTFSTGVASETAFINNISNSGKSDANGLVTAKLNLGTDKTNRTIPISASIAAEGVTTTTSIDVTGTNITIAGNTSMVLGDISPLTLTLKDSAGKAVSGLLTVASAAGNEITFRPGTGITCASASTCKADTSGQLIAEVKATKNAAADTITVTGGGTSKSQDLAINTASFGFTAPKLAAGATSIDIPLFNALVPSSSPTVSIQWFVNSLPVKNTQVTFSTTRGTLIPANGTVLTDANGVASVTISSNLAGPAIITAAGVAVAGAIAPPAATLKNVAFVAQSAANVTVQAVPGTVAVSLSELKNQTNNASTISAVVRDAAGNLVKNAGITFLLTDVSGGGLNSGTARTDINGSASVTYTAGAVSSAANGVTIRATVTDITSVGAITPVSSGVPNYPDATLTVANQPLLIRLGTDNKVATSGTNNQKTYSAFVTDASGNAIAGATVRFALRPGRYAKGTFFYSSIAVRWTQNFTTLDPYVVGNAECANEDVNFNGILDAGEDVNGSKALEPGGVATVTPSSISDSNGVATAVVTYPKDHSYWTEVILEARAGVVGNDPPTTTTFFLPGPNSEYTDPGTQPPGVRSPYGVSNTCTDTQ